MKDRRPSDESWSEKCQRLQDEQEAEEKARRNEPGMLKIQKTITFDSMFGWLTKRKNKKNETTSPSSVNDASSDKLQCDEREEGRP